jgi:hypothetical protein
MVFHGLIHLMGFFNELGIAKIQELSGKTLISLPDYMHSILGVVWLIACVLFILSAIGLVTKRSWWKKITVIAVIVSQVLIIIWWPDAKNGTIANALIMLGYFVL